MTSATELLLPGGEKAGMRGSDRAAVALCLGTGHPHPTLSLEGEGLKVQRLLGISPEGSVG